MKSHVFWGLAAAQDSKQLETRDRRQGILGDIYTPVGSLARERFHGTSHLLMQRSSFHPQNCEGGASTSCLVLSIEGQGQWRQAVTSWCALRGCLMSTCGLCHWGMRDILELECQSLEQQRAHFRGIDNHLSRKTKYWEDSGLGGHPWLAWGQRNQARLDRDGGWAALLQPTCWAGLALNSCSIPGLFSSGLTQSALFIMNVIKPSYLCMWIFQPHCARF